MPVLNESDYKRLAYELRGRVSVLVEAFENRPLKNSREGCPGRNHWTHPDLKCATRGNASELRMAIDDFKTILAELRRLK